MNYSQTLDYLYSQLPMFHRIGAAAYKANLDNTIAICSLLGNPENKFRSVHVAGTNGKGSTSHLIASILQCAGYKVGLYTSPHLNDFRERIKINGKMIAKDAVIEFVRQYKDDFGKIKPSFFEWTVGLAFDHFAKSRVDIAVIEAGLGGRLDSTNVITPLVSVITNISYDHTALLGDTLEKIAHEKAGIIKKRVPVVIGETQKESAPVFIKKAKLENAPIVFADDFIGLKNTRQVNRKGKLFLSGQLALQHVKGKPFPLLCELPGAYQAKNICTAVAAVHVLNSYLGIHLSQQAIAEGLEKVVSKTGLLGRWQVLQRKPLVIADTGHNEAGIKEVLEQIRKIPHKKLHIVFGAVNDKDISNILALLPKKAAYYFCQANIPRALDARVLAALAVQQGLKGNIYPSVRKAVKAAKTAAAKNDLVFIGGSTFVVAEAI
ncbi:MAG: folylpolyglutamate synthase/dihydrofolate synthase family protein [Bacteroidota bacterium]